jgi:tetratricopeptide (TPR) repeat protein
MSNVSLRVYNREIETMIEGGRLDEAVAHCQHILKTFPMYVEIYRLLGKSFLEARRYTDAADIFQRTLMAVPDDFVAHVGMSIIRDDEGKLDEAIWHMERAFEDQPSNTAIQNELRRLYGRRDGIEPPKIRLSRDALANMYAQGELFNQAIAEIRSVLADDPDRADLQVMLARAYYRAGQKVEAAEAAANLLKKYNYCLDALRILVDVLPESSQTENTQVYRQRLHMLDPYSSFVAGSVFSTDQVPDASVNVERLEYVPSAVPASTQPNWASTLGIKLAEEKRSESTPEWMTTKAPAETRVEKPPKKPIEKPEEKAAIPEPIMPPAEPAPEGVDKSVPEWMRSAGWKESAVNVPQEPVELEAQKPAEPLEKGDIPEWLQSMAPQGISEASSSPEQVQATPSSAGEGDIPEWLKGLGTVGAVEVTSEPTRAPIAPQEANVFPDWLKEMDATPASAPTVAAPEEKLEQSLSEEEPVAAQPGPLQPFVEMPSKPESTVARRVEEEMPFQPTGEPKPLRIDDDAMAWLEGLAAKQGAKEEELLTKPGDRSEEMPDWLRSTREEAAFSAIPEPVPAKDETLPLEPFSPPAGELGIQTPLPPEIPPTEPTVEPVQPMSVPAETLVPEEGMARIEENPKLEDFQPEQIGTSEEIPPVIPIEETPQPLITEADSDAWLKNLMGDQTLQPQETQFLASGPSEEIPVEKPIEETLQPFSAGIDKEAWTDESIIGQTAQPEEIQIPAVPLVEELQTSATPLSEEIQTSAAAPSEELPPEKLPAVTPQPFTLKDESEAWRETVTADQNIQPEEIQTKTNIPVEEIPSEKPAGGTPQPTSLDVDTDAWLEEPEITEQKIQAEELLPSSTQQGEAQPEWMQTPTPEPVVPKKTPVSEAPSAPQEEDITITSWLNKHDVEAALGKARSTSHAAPSKELPKEELPDWLKEPEKPTVPEKATEESAIPEIAPKADERIPGWLGQAARPAEMEAETIPAPSIPPEQEMPAWVDETTPVIKPPAPTTPGEWISAEEKPVPIPEPEEPPKPAPLPVDTPLQRQILGGTGMLSRIPPEDKDAEFLSAAQTALDARDIKKSMQEYAKLIKKNRLLDEVIHDLREAIYRFPVDISIWQTLGDASMRANRLQDALDAYTKAEELLR